MTVRKRWTLLPLLFWLSAALAFAESPAKTLLKKVDSLDTFDNSDFSALYTIVQYKPGQGTSTTKAVIFRRDAKNEYLIMILSPPSDKGKGYLKIGNNLWLYDPVSRTFTFTSAKARFRNSNARNSDFTHSSFATNYNVTGQSTQQLGPYHCRVLDLKANNDGVTFPITKLWISSGALVRKAKDYSLSGQLLRTMLIPTYQKVGTRMIPRKIIMVDGLKGRKVNGKFEGNRTEITITRPSLARLPANLFTKDYVEKISP